jgi:hypothetical protein
VSALRTDAFEPPAFVARHNAASARRRQARRYIRIPNSALATDSFPESILERTIGGSAGVPPAAFGVLAECGDVRNGTLQTATGTVALPISEFRMPQRTLFLNPF